MLPCGQIPAHSSRAWRRLTILARAIQAHATFEAFVTDQTEPGPCAGRVLWGNPQN